MAARERHNGDGDCDDNDIAQKWNSPRSSPALRRVVSRNVRRAEAVFAEIGDATRNALMDSRRVSNRSGVTERK